MQCWYVVANLGAKVLREREGEREGGGRKREKEGDEKEGEREGERESQRRDSDFRQFIVLNGQASVQVNMGNSGCPKT